MKISVYFGDNWSKISMYLDNQTPVKQVNKIKELIELGENFDIRSNSPYIIEAIDAYGKKVKAEIKYYSSGIEKELVYITNEISEAFYIIQDIKEER